MDFATTSPLFLILIIIPLIFYFRKSLVDRPKIKKVSSFVFRTLALLFLIFSLCKPYTLRSINDRHIIYLVDLSESVDLNDVRKKIKDIEEHITSLKSGDSWDMFSFAKSIRKSTPEKLTQFIDRWDKGLKEDDFRSESYIGNALKTSRMAFPSDKVKEIILFSDGLNTGTELNKALDLLSEEKILLSYSPLQSITKPEASVLSLHTKSKVAYHGEMIQLEASISSNLNMNCKVKLFHQDVLLKEIKTRLDKEIINHLNIETVVRHSGHTEYKLEIEPEHDYFPLNNFGSCTVEVSGKAKILALHENTSKLRSLSRALKKQGLAIEVRGKMGMPEDLDELLKYDALMLADIAATNLTHRQMQNIKSYVTDFGGGLIMTGSENSFGLGGYYKSPVEEVLPIVSRYEKEKEKPSLAMVIIIDKSGSMSGLPIQMARMASKAAVELLSRRDQVSVIAFDSQAYAACDMTYASDQEMIHGSIDSIAAGGGTNMYPAMALGKEMLTVVPARIKHMILLGDGMSSGGDFEGIASDMANENITISTVALGSGADRQLMHAIATIGRGRYYETMEAESIPRIFTRETMEASKSAIREEPFSANELGKVDFLDGIDFDNAPFLLGHIMTKSKPTASVHLITDSGEPLLATARFGLGTSAAFTSDATEKWAGEWLEWRDFGKFWSQIFRRIVRKNDSEGIIVDKEESQDKIIYTINRRDESRKPLNGILWEALLIHEHGGKEKAKVEEIGVGRYRIAVKKKEQGKLHLLLKDATHMKTKSIVYKNDYPQEYRLESNVSEKISSLNQWELNSDKPEQKIKSHVASQNLFLILGLFCMITGILLRRI